MLLAGKKLREMREQIGLTLRDVEIASTTLAEARGLDEFIVTSSRLSDIETKGVVPSLHRLYVLAVVYRESFTELLKLYGIDLTEWVADFFISTRIKTNLVNLAGQTGEAQIPVKLDPSFDSHTSVNLSRMVQQWGVVPLQYLNELAKTRYAYAYIGSDDLTMYPLILPGSFIQIDEARSEVQEGKWRSEYERPIYFVETRDGYVCCWCSMRGQDVVLQPHPLSNVLPRVLRSGTEVEVIGQVVGVAMRLDAWTASPGPVKPPNAE